MFIDCCGVCCSGAREGCQPSASCFKGKISEERINHTSVRVGVRPHVTWPHVGVRPHKAVIERPVQHLYFLELTCDMTMAPAALNPTVPAFRPQRNPAVAARACIQELAQTDDQD